MFYIVLVNQDLHEKLQLLQMQYFLLQNKMNDDDDDNIHIMIIIQWNLQITNIVGTISFSFI